MENWLLTGSALSASLLPFQESTWRERDIILWGGRCRVFSPNTAVFRNRLVGRLLRKFPFDRMGTCALELPAGPGGKAILAISRDQGGSVPLLTPPLTNGLVAGINKGL
jgi:hypothetical protein